MSNLLQDLACFLISRGHENITRDILLDEPDECIALFVFATPLDGFGFCTRHVQIQVRHPDPDVAQTRCWAISTLLDSEAGENIIHLTQDRWVIARPSARPKKMSEDERQRTVYYCEVALAGEDKE